MWRGHQLTLGIGRLEQLASSFLWLSIISILQHMFDNITWYNYIKWLRFPINQWEISIFPYISQSDWNLMLDGTSRLDWQSTHFGLGHESGVEFWQLGMSCGPKPSETWMIGSYRLIVLFLAMKVKVYITGSSYMPSLFGMLMDTRWYKWTWMDTVVANARLGRCLAALFLFGFAGFLRVHLGEERAKGLP